MIELSFEKNVTAKWLNSYFVKNFLSLFIEFQKQIVIAFSDNRQHFFYVELILFTYNYVSVFFFFSWNT